MIILNSVNNKRKVKDKDILTRHRVDKARVSVFCFGQFLVYKFISNI